MTGPVVIITGASRGIGKAAAIKALTVFNAKIVAVARDINALKALKEQVAKDFDKGESIQIVSGDLTDPSTAQKAVDVAISTWGKLDSIIANAGLLEPIVSIADGSVEDWKKLFDVNVFSIISLVQISIPFLRKSDRGSIVLVSSGAAVKGYKGWGAYGA
ncbi:hypothetical protein BY458DRAFT_437010 [Sporodiniella umbellata]|nr:hypothetical protein BY458DRAFT_437010 [Sporodiniella umbellata]